ncbi:MAG: hypothetical protein IH592_14665 [Bacteroidales bacterium]|nr:hypothetical protein [Bacteroidales bacterium]
MNAKSDYKTCGADHHLSFYILLFFVVSVLPSNGQIDTTGKELRSAVDTIGQDLTRQIDATGKELINQIDTIDQELEDQKTPRRYLSLFEEEDMLDVSLRFDIAKFLKKADRDQSIDGIMTMHFSKTDSLESKVTLKYRGQSRFERCRYPPTRITFKKSLYEVSDSGRIKKMKLVNQCQQGSVYGDYVIREYLVYKLYNVVTDTSFRARLISLNFIDSENKRKTITQYGILIEPEGLLEHRLNLLEVRTKALSMRHMNPALMDRIAIFNYMVSNWDWSVPGQHNISVFTSLKPELAGLGIPVPFDFDLTGVVNADYAIPPPGLGIETNRDRMFSGICRTREVYQGELMSFLEKKEEFYSVVNDFPYLSKAEKRDIIVFLDQFFDRLEKPKSLDNIIDYFLGNCKDFQ